MIRPGIHIISQIEISKTQFRSSYYGIVKPETSFIPNVPYISTDLPVDSSSAVSAITISPSLSK